LIDRALRNRDFQRLLLAGILYLLFCLPAQMQAGIGEIGEKLKTYFPLEKNDRNELPDSISEER